MLVKIKVKIIIICEEDFLRNPVRLFHALSEAVTLANIS